MRSTCATCDKPLDGAHRTYCKFHAAEYARNWRAKNKERHDVYRLEWWRNNRDKARVYKRKSYLKFFYGMTVEDYDALLAQQDGKCAICLQPPSQKQPRLFVDHNHATGENRGLLCSKCNFAVGLVDEDVENAQRMIAYLLHHNHRAESSEGGN